MKLARLAFLCDWKFVNIANEDELLVHVWLIVYIPETNKRAKLLKIQKKFVKNYNIKNPSSWHNVTAVRRMVGISHVAKGNVRFTS